MFSTQTIGQMERTARIREKNAMRLLIVIPAFNEEESILETITELTEVCPQYDYLVVNDGSTDRTGQICRENRFNMLDLPINLGLSGAFQAGMKYAEVNGYDAVAQFDADGQHKPEYLKPMLEELEKGRDIVIGSRFCPPNKKPMTLRMFGSHLICLAICLTTRKKINDPTCGLRMYNRRMIHVFVSQVNVEPEPDSIAYLMSCGADVSEIQVEVRRRRAGKSYLSPVKSILYMIKMGISIMLVQAFRRRIPL